MTRLLWIALRFSLCSWVGAAVLFVVTGILQVMTPDFDSRIKNHLAVIRFPAYYLFGFTHVGLAIVAALGLLVATRRRAAGRLALKVILGLCVAAVLVMTFDYFRVYRPLEAMMLDKSEVMPSTFHELHQWSKRLNFASLGMCLIAGLIAVGTRERSEP